MVSSVLGSLLAAHIMGGTVGLISGMVALVAPKGRRLHSVAGTVFFVGMMVLVVSGFLIAGFKFIPISILVAAISAYFLMTSLRAVTVPAGRVLIRDRQLCFAGGLISTAGFVFGLFVATGLVIDPEGFPAPAYFLFSGITWLAVRGDKRMIAAGGYKGRQRITRHLWRMCFVLLIAAISIFFGNPDVFPDFIHEAEVLHYPVLFVLGLSAFWFIRVRYTGWTKKLAFPWA